MAGGHGPVVLPYRGCLGLKALVDEQLVATSQSVIVAEHTAHVGDLANIPCSHRLVETARFLKHRPHVDDLTYIPRSYRLVEIPRLLEHTLHVCDLAKVPRSQGLVEVSCSIEHSLHGGDLTNVPRIDILIESKGRSSPIAVVCAWAVGITFTMPK